MIMMQVTLIAVMAKAQMTKPVEWTLDGKFIGNRTSMVIEVPANSGTHEVCATLKDKTRCVKFAAAIEAATTLPIGMD